MTEPTNPGESGDDGDRTPEVADGVTPIDLDPERESVSGPSLRQARMRKLGLTISAPVAAFIFALIIVAIVIIASGFNIGAVLDSVQETMGRGRNIIELINRTGMYYISALAVAVGFRMNLFNIGVEGQYRLAALVAAYVGASVNNLPGVLHIFVMVLAASVTGALWAGIAGILKVTRGVSEVISTIMLNAIAAALIGFLLRDGGWSPDPGGRKPFTEKISESGWFPDLNNIVNPILDAFGFEKPPPSTKTYGFIIIAVLLGVTYAFLLKRTRFGFDLRASGQNPTAAAASGVSAKKMTIYAMFISGGIAGLVGMAELLGGNQHNFSETFLSGFGFIGIAVALLGRNSPIGMFFAAIVWAFLDVATRGFQIIGISNKLASIMQAVVLFAVVIAYTVVSRRAKEAEARSVAANTPAHPVEVPAGVAPATDSPPHDPDDVDRPHRQTTDDDGGEGPR